MMDQGELRSMAGAARLCPVPVSPATVMRWCTRGIQARNNARIYLSHQRVGRRLFTTTANLEAFFQALKANDHQKHEASAVSKSYLEADRRCRELGI